MNTQRTRPAEQITRSVRMINAYIILVGTRQTRHFKDMAVDERKLTENIWIDFYLSQYMDY
jgi:hypothetical protein